MTPEKEVVMGVGGRKEVRKGGWVSVGRREGVVVGSRRRGQLGSAQGWMGECGE